MDTERLLLKPADVASRLGIGRAAVYRLIAEGQLPTVRVGSRARVPLEALLEWVRRRTTAESHSPDAA
jgi:excisionase family DNA binding protein